MNRQAAIEQLHLPDQVWDVIVIGGGASGLGIAVDAASRGLRTVLFEAEDFGAEFTPELREQEERLRAQAAGKK